MNRTSPGTSNPAAPERTAERFCVEVLPYLRHADEAGLCSHLRSFWAREELLEFLRHEDADVARIAAISVGLVGCFEDTPALSRSLYHDDYFVVAVAERALLCIWFRASDDRCNNLLHGALESMRRSNWPDAEQLLDQVLIAHADFAEAWNQRAVLYHLTERYQDSLLACHRALELNPHHFGAAAGLGHNHFHLGRYDAATEAYRRALRLHPRMEGVRQAMRRTREAAHPDGNEWSRPTLPGSVFTVHPAIDPCSALTID